MRHYIKISILMLTIIFLHFSGKTESKDITINYKDGVYTGDLKDSLPHGFGYIKYSNGETYKGYFKNGKPDSVGVYKYPNGVYYVGEFKNGVIQGNGTLFIDGDRLEGNFANNLANGDCVYYHSDGDYFEAFYVNGEPSLIKMVYDQKNHKKS